MRIDAIKTGTNPPDDINVIIEVPVGGEPIKYEMDKASGALFVDRFLYTPMRYPGNYGFVPHTLSADGDPIDVLVCNTRAIVPGAVASARAPRPPRTTAVVAASRCTRPADRGTPGKTIGERTLTAGSSVPSLVNPRKFTASVPAPLILPFGAM